MKKQKQPAPNADTNSKPVLRLDWCTHEAAKYAVEKWHYSRSMSVGKQVFIGVWESGEFIGAVIFGRGANRHMAGEFGLTVIQCVELTRVAISQHATAVSRIVMIAIKKLVAQSPGLRLIVSYADPEHGHYGGIYQAMGWGYIGTSRPQSSIVGMHKRTATAKYGTTKGLPRTKSTWKHKYIMPLDAAMRAQIEPLRKPYPKRVRGVDSDTSANHAEEGGANPTRTLSSPEGNQ